MTRTVSVYTEWKELHAHQGAIILITWFSLVGKWEMKQRKKDNLFWTKGKEKTEKRTGWKMMKGGKKEEKKKDLQKMKEKNRKRRRKRIFQPSQITCSDAPCGWWQVTNDYDPSKIPSKWNIDVYIYIYIYRTLTWMFMPFITGAAASAWRHASTNTHSRSRKRELTQTFSGELNRWHLSLWSRVSQRQHTACLAVERWLVVGQSVHCVEIPDQR